jgi:hypothetical protein
MSASNYFENVILNVISNNGSYTPTTLSLGLYTSNPSEAGTGSELIADSYQRKVVTFGAAVGGTMTNNAEVLFDQATTDWPTAFYFGVLDTANNLLFYGALTSPTTAEIGESIRFQTGTISVSLD